MASHGLVRSNVLGVDALRFFDQRLLDLRNRTDAQRFKLFLHAADRPEEIDRGRTRLANGFTDLVEVVLEVSAIFRLGVFYAERNAHSGCDANGGSATDHHIADD